jgi:hypothetical protein
MLATRRAVSHSRRRKMPARARGRVYTGKAVTRCAESRVFFYRRTKQVTSGGPLADWIGAALMLAAIAGWGTLLMVLSG